MLAGLAVIDPVNRSRQRHCTISMFIISSDHSIKDNFCWQVAICLFIVTTSVKTRAI